MNVVCGGTGAFGMPSSERQAAQRMRYRKLALRLGWRALMALETVIAQDNNLEVLGKKMGMTRPYDARQAGRAALLAALGSVAQWIL